MTLELLNQLLILKDLDELLDFSYSPLASKEIPGKKNKKKNGTQPIPTVQQILSDALRGLCHGIIRFMKEISSFESHKERSERWGKSINYFSWVVSTVVNSFWMTLNSGRLLELHASLNMWTVCDVNL